MGFGPLTTSRLARKFPARAPHRMLATMNRIPARPAHLGWRLVAMIYDLLPLLALWLLASGLMLLAHRGAPVAPDSATAIAEFGVLWLTTGAYAVVSWRRGGQTIGMRPWRLRVVAADGMPPSWRAVYVRYAVASISLLAFGIGFIWALFDRQRRTWHDLAAGTVLVRLPG